MFSQMNNIERQPAIQLSPLSYTENSGAINFMKYDYDDLLDKKFKAIAETLDVK